MIIISLKLKADIFISAYYYSLQNSSLRHTLLIQNMVTTFTYHLKNIIIVKQ
jgi:hypothetical protein